jgi:hypothetical protein
MDELVNRISETIGATQGDARKAVLITAGYLKSKLTPSLANEIDLVLDLEKITEEETKYLGTFHMP